MNKEDTVEVISKVAHKHYRHVGKIIKECNTRWNERMFLVEFGLNDKAKFYESSLKVKSLSR